MDTLDSLIQNSAAEICNIIFNETEKQYYLTNKFSIIVSLHTSKILYGWQLV